MKKLYILLFTILLTSFSFGQVVGIDVFINEIHYDNTGGDVGEGVEIAGPAGIDLSAFTITLYNGSAASGAPYDMTTLSGSIPDEGGSGFGTIFFAISGMQNGSPDGIALDDGTDVQFLSYEGAFVADGGVADGMMSIDIGVSEGGGTAIGESLQLSGTGMVYADFTWNAPAASSNDLINPGQTFGATVPTITITSPADMAILASGTTSVDIDFTALNLNMGDQVDITVIKNGGAPTTTLDVTSSPFTIMGVADGDTYSVNVIIFNMFTIDSDIVNFSIAFPCDLMIGTITTTCDAITPGVDTYTTTIDFTGGGTSTYTIDTGGVGTVMGDDPSSVATGTISITEVDEGVDFSINFLGDAANSSCNINRNINSPNCFNAVCSSVGDIIITEIMQNPDIVTDGNGEYFEVFNTTGSPIDMQGWIIRDETTAAETHTIGTSVIVPANGYVVFGINSDFGANGGVTVDYEYSTISLGNGTDGLILECSLTTIDAVTWDNGATFPDPTGASMELSTTTLNSTDNDNGANWNEAVAAFGSGDFGTPGAVNDFTLSINDLENNNFKIYPNPTSLGFVNIISKNNETINATVFDILGKQVINSTVTNNRLDVSNLNTGVYIMRIIQNNATTTKKLVIQ